MAAGPGATMGEDRDVVAFLRFPRQLLPIQRAGVQEHTPPLEPTQERHGGHPQDPGHAGDREPEAADGEDPDRRSRGHHRPAARAAQQVEMLREQGPRVDPPRSLFHQGTEALNKVPPVPVVPDDGPPLDPPHHDVVLARLSLAGTTPGLVRRFFGGASRRGREARGEACTRLKTLQAATSRKPRSPSGWWIPFELSDHVLRGTGGTGRGTGRVEPGNPSCRLPLAVSAVSGFVPV